MVEGKSRPYQVTLEWVAVIQPKYALSPILRCHDHRPTRYSALNRFLKGEESLTPEVPTARTLVNVMLRAHGRA
jgi:hypothetical protein